MRYSLPWFGIALAISASAQAGPVGDAAKTGDTSEIERLMASGASANEEDTVASPLHWAAMNGNADVLQILMEHGAEIEAVSQTLGTPLLAAVRFGRHNAVEILLSAGANPNARDGKEYTPLMVATTQSRPEIAQLLIDGGADIDAVVSIKHGGGYEPGFGRLNALHIARHDGLKEMTDVLVAAGAGPAPLVDPGELLDDANAMLGRDLAQVYCGESCHFIEKGQPAKQGRISGPPLTGIIGRPVATYPGFEFSDALKDFGGEWTPIRLYSFGLQPMLTAPGTLMHWSPDVTPEIVADITAYFVSVSE